jgi:hypothetical protein
LFEDGEAGERVYIRAPAVVLERFKALPPDKRGRVVEAGLEVLELLEVQDAKTHEQTP